jgi:hypothetical protein
MYMYLLRLLSVPGFASPNYYLFQQYETRSKDPFPLFGSTQCASIDDKTLVMMTSEIKEPVTTPTEEKTKSGKKTTVLAAPPVKGKEVATGSGAVVATGDGDASVQSSVETRLAHNAAVKAKYVADKQLKFTTRLLSR